MKSSLVRWCAVALPLVLAGMLLAQDPPAKPGPKKPPVEEDDTPKTQKKKPPVEEDDASKTPKKKPPTEDEEGPGKKPARPDKESSTPKNPATAVGNTIDLAQLAATAVHPDVKQLYQSVAVRSDWIQLRSNRDLTQVEPLSVYIGSKANVPVINYRTIGPDGKSGAALVSVNPGGIVRGVTYEEHAIDEASNFLVDMEKIPEGNAKFLPRHECLAIAEIGRAHV
jgi:hypothetical protein